MDYLFFISGVIFLLLYIYKIVRFKNFLHFTTFFIIGTYFPLILYFLRFSELILKNIHFLFYTNFFYLNIILSIFLIIKKSKKNDEIIKADTFNIKLKNSHYIYILDIFYFFIFLLENYLLSGSFFPILIGIDIHVEYYPIINFFTHSPSPFIFLNYIFYMKTKKKRFLFLLILLMFIPFISRGSRLVSIISIISLFIFIIFKNLSINFKKSKMIKIIIMILIILLAFSTFTNLRASQFGKYEFSYSKAIEYTGPFKESTVIPFLYGYFSLSFDNLNRSLYNYNDSINSFGLYTFKSIFGVLQFDNIFSINLYKLQEYRDFGVGAATVNTMYYDFIFDFGYLSFIPIFIVVFIMDFLYKCLYKNILSIKMIYSYLASLLMLSGFQNLFFASTVPMNIFLILIFSKIFIKKKGNEYIYEKNYSNFS